MNLYLTKTHALSFLHEILAYYILFFLTLTKYLKKKYGKKEGWLFLIVNLTSSEKIVSVICLHEAASVQIYVDLTRLYSMK